MVLSLEPVHVSVYVQVTLMYIDLNSFFKGREISSMNGDGLLGEGNIFDSKGVCF